MCKYCDDKYIEDDGTLFRFDGKEFYLYRNSICTTGDIPRKQLNYCPMCGRNLKED